MFHVNDEPKGKFLYTETIKLYCIVLYCIVLYFPCHSYVCYRLGRPVMGVNGRKTPSYLFMSITMFSSSTSSCSEKYRQVVVVEGGGGGVGVVVVVVVMV